MKKILAIICFFGMPVSAADLQYSARAVPLTPPSGTYIEEVPGVAVSNDEKLVYVFNRGRRALMVFDANGGFVSEIGAGLFKVPHGLRVAPDGTIWTTDTGTHLVLQFSPAGEILMVLGKRGTASEGWFDRDYHQYFFNKPSDVAVDPSGNIYVADGGNFRVLKFAPDGTVLKVFGEKGTGPGQFNFPHSLLINAEGLLLVADRENKRIQIFNEAGSYQGEWAQIGYPYMLAHSADGGIWMTDARADKLVKLSPSGAILGTFGAPGKSVGKYGFLHGIASIGEDLLVSDILNWKIERLSPIKKDK